MRRLRFWTPLRRLCSSASHENADAPAPEKAADAFRANTGIRGFIDSGDGAGAAKTGRAWRTAELRLKSYEDLHRLWYVLLRERNILLTEKEWCKTNRRHWLRGQSNLVKVKKSMARLKGVVGERARAYNVRMKAVETQEAEKGVSSALDEQARVPDGIRTQL